MKKSAKPHTDKKKPKKGSKGLKGVAKVAAAKKGMGEVVKPFGIIIGLAASSLAGHGIDKIKFLEPDPTNEGFQVKSLVKPALLLLAGAGTVFGTHGKPTPAMQFVNGLGWGFITGGTFNVVKVVLKKDPFGGLGKSETTETDADYYKEQMNEMAKVLEQNKFKVELPKLSSAEESEEMKGITSVERELEMKDVKMII
ncbi:MAG: hypothetical protein K8R85_00620 [Bacteroidetes bacterium]|nr:hypothetical protein [Bacteroidota bacterium]